jgi:single-stranded DNA-binding protein
VQRSFETEGHKRTVVEIQVQHVGPDLQFATAQVEKVTNEKATAEKEALCAAKERYEEFVGLPAD